MAENNIPNMSNFNGINLVNRNKNGNPVNENGNPIIPHMKNIKENNAFKRNKYGYKLNKNGKQLHSSIVYHRLRPTKKHPLQGGSYKRKYRKHKTKQTRRFRK